MSRQRLKRRLIKAIRYEMQFIKPPGGYLDTAGLMQTHRLINRRGRWPYNELDRITFRKSRRNR